MEILASRILVRPRDLTRSLAFYEETLGLAVYRTFGAGAHRGVVFFLGGGFLEISGRGDAVGGPVRLWLQVRDIHATRDQLAAAGVTIDEPPVQKPWGLWEMQARDPDDVVLVFIEVPEDHPLRRDPHS